MNASFQMPRTFRFADYILTNFFILKLISVFIVLNLAEAKSWQPQTSHRLKALLPLTPYLLPLKASYLILLVLIGKVAALHIVDVVAHSIDDDVANLGIVA